MPEQEIITAPMGTLPEGPAYPNMMNWSHDKEANTWTIDDAGFMALVKWRMKVEGYYRDVDILWNGQSDTTAK